MKEFTVTALTILLIVFSPRFSAADTEIISKGKSGDKHFFQVNEVLLGLSVGDTIDDCLVTEDGLQCGNGIDLPPAPIKDVFGEVLRLKVEQQKCEDKLAEVERKCQERYLENISDFTTSLKQKNYELVRLTREIEELKANLAIHEKITEEYTARLQRHEGKIQVAAAQQSVRNDRPATTSVPSAPVKKVAAPQKHPRPRKKQAKTTQAPSGPLTGSITLRRSWSNIRKSPSVDSDIVSQGLKGDAYSVLDYSQGWYRISLDDGATGWISRQIVRRDKTAGPRPPKDIKAVVVKKPSTHIRAGAGTHYDSMGIGLKGDRYKIQDQTQNWLLIRMKNGKDGWVHRSMVD